MTKPMTSEQVAEKHKQLCAKIRRYDRLYYVDGAPEISDKEYDAIFQELLDLEKQYPKVKAPDSPTQRVGGEPVEGLEHVTHGEYMLSIDNAFTSEALKTRWDKWVAELKNMTPTVRIEPKIDGVAVSLLYTNGVLTGAVTPSRCPARRSVRAESSGRSPCGPSRSTMQTPTTRTPSMA